MDKRIKCGRLEPSLDKMVIDLLEKLRQEVTPLLKKSMADDDIDNNLAEVFESIGKADAYFTLYHAAASRAERAMQEYRKKEEEQDHEQIKNRDCSQTQ